MDEISIYVHIPFCKSKCLYCDFLSFPSMEDRVDSYIAALIKEIKAFNRAKTVKSLFIGGGTPSVIDSKYICLIVNSLKNSLSFSPDAEITIEANPGTVNMEKLKDYIGCGINRISFGVQTLDDGLLKAIGRIHNRAQCIEGVKLAKKAGFKNINCDLMFALPGQSCSQLLESIKQLAALGVNHISMYSLIIEEGTPFYSMYENGQLQPVTQEEDRLMYHAGVDLLEKLGYHQYEISNFARDGYCCSHNLVYWYRGDYKGFGLGAASLLDNVRTKNTESFNAYVAGENKQETEVLTLKDMQEEFMFLGLRCNKGVSEEAFFKAFNVEIDSIYGSAINDLVGKNLILRQNGRLFLTKLGFDLANMVFVEFMQ